MGDEPEEGEGRCSRSRSSSSSALFDRARGITDTGEAFTAVHGRRIESATHR